MEAIKKQASKLREQVAKQQQLCRSIPSSCYAKFLHLVLAPSGCERRVDPRACGAHDPLSLTTLDASATLLLYILQAILRQLGQLGHEAVIVDEAEAQYHEQLQNLYKSTRAAKHFQKDIIRGVEGLITTNRKQMEIARRLAEDCCKYGIENQSDASTLAKAASEFGTSHASMENHRETMVGILGYQVSEPLRASIKGAPLEDARHLTHQYDRVRQEFESQVAEVIRRKTKCRDPSAEDVIKLKSAETKLIELKSSMLALGREATEAMMSVEEQQQQITFQKLLTMVDAERSYHQNVAAVLEKLYSEMILEEQLNDSSPRSAIPQKDGDVPSACEDTTSNGSDVEVHEDKNWHRDKCVPSAYEDNALNQPDVQGDKDKNHEYFIAKVIHSFDAQEDGELSLAVGDYVVVRQEANGWSEGECNGEAGWFPSAYVERTDIAPASKISEDNSIS